MAFHPVPKHAIANCSHTHSPMLPPGEYKQAIPPFVKLFRSLLLLLFETNNSNSAYNCELKNFFVVFSKFQTRELVGALE